MSSTARAAISPTALRSLLEAGQRFTVISLTRPFGEATALMAGFEHASGQIIVTLPAYHQIEAADVGKLVAALDSSDLAIGRRWPRAGGTLERLRRSVFHGLLAWVTRLQYHDLGCGARAFHRRVLEEIQLYGDQHRFLPVLADRQGFRVREVELRQSPKDRFEGVYQPREYTRGFLDIFTVFFLVRFTKKPLRFFGMVGVTPSRSARCWSPGWSSSACSSTSRWPSGPRCCCRRCWSCSACSFSRSACSAS